VSKVCQNYVISRAQPRKHWVQVVEDFRHILPGDNRPEAALAAEWSSPEDEPAKDCTQLEWNQHPAPGWSGEGLWQQTCTL